MNKHDRAGLFYGLLACFTATRLADNEYGLGFLGWIPMMLSWWFLVWRSRE